MKHEIKIEHKGESIEVRQTSTKPELFISGKKQFGGEKHHSFLSNKQVVCKIYDALLQKIKETPKGYFKSLDFPDLVDALLNIVAADEFLRKLRDLNCDYYGQSNMKEKVGEEVKSAVRAAIGFDYGSTKKFTDPENWVLFHVSNEYVGQRIFDYDLAELFDPAHDDETKLLAKLKEFKKYPLTKFIDEGVASGIVAKVEKDFELVQSQITTFRKMKAVAGDDLVNWGPHKYASQAKRNGIKDKEYRAQGWLLNDLREHLLKKGIKPAEKKESSIAKLKERAGAQSETLSQEDLIRLFKSSTESQCAEHVSRMTPATAVSLLGMTTKNVVEKLYDTRDTKDRDGKITHTPKSGLKAIVQRVASGHHPVEYGVLLGFIRGKGLFEACTWQLFLNHADSVPYSKESKNDFLAFLSKGIHSLPEDQKYLDRGFFDKVIRLIPLANKYNWHSFVSDAFLRYQADDAEKIQAMQDFKQLLTGKQGIKINWDLSHEHFLNLPYSFIKEFNSYNLDHWDHFRGVIFQNKDAETAKRVLIESPFYNNPPIEFFELFSFEEKVEILDTTKGSFEKDITKILKPTELKDFGRIALTKKNLADYIPELPIDYLNENVQVADVTARIVGSQVTIPLTKEIIRGLSKEAAGRIIARAKIEASQYEEISLKKELYGKLDRKELLEVIGGSFVDHPDRMALVGFMTPEELCSSADKDKEFFRSNVDKLPDQYVSRFKDKKAFKETVGDRRNRNNNSFAKRLESRLSGLNQSSG